MVRAVYAVLLLAACGGRGDPEGAWTGRCNLKFDDFYSYTSSYYGYDLVYRFDLALALEVDGDTLEGDGTTDLSLVIDGEPFYGYSGYYGDSGGYYGGGYTSTFHGPVRGVFRDRNQVDMGLLFEGLVLDMDGELDGDRIEGRCAVRAQRTGPGFGGGGYDYGLSGEFLLARTKGVLGPDRQSARARRGSARRR